MSNNNAELKKPDIKETRCKKTAQYMIAFIENAYQANLQRENTHHLCMEMGTNINCKWQICQPNISQEKSGLAKVMKDKTDFKIKHYKKYIK